MSDVMYDPSAFTGVGKQIKQNLHLAASSKVIVDPFKSLTKVFEMKEKSLIRSTVVTEKSANAIKQNKYVFYVDSSVNKIQIADAVEKKYGVKVLGVNVNNVKGKVKSRGRLVGKTSDRRKAWVTVAAGQEIVEVKALF